MSDVTTASVIRLENAVATQHYEQACHELLLILTQIDDALGKFTAIECDYPQQLLGLAEEKTAHFCQRVANAVTTLFDAKNAFGISQLGFQRFMAVHRWLAMIFASSSFVNTDHIIATFHTGEQEHVLENLQLANDLNVWRKFCILYSLESNIFLTLDVLWEVSEELCIALCLALQSYHFVGTQLAFDKRTAILKWLPSKLMKFTDLEALPASIIHHAYAHSSYDIDKNKHQIKAALNQVIRKYVLSLGFGDRKITNIGRVNDKPVMFVVLEEFHSNSLLYAKYAKSLQAAREQFYVIGFGDIRVDTASQGLFDEFVVLDSHNVIDRLQLLVQSAQKFEPAVLYLPSVGMDLTTIFVSNIRLAAVQAVGLTHNPSTTRSEFIDYAMIEDGYTQPKFYFSEQLLPLPKGALPYLPLALTRPQEYQLRQNPQTVNIAVTSTTLRINPYFLMVCQAIHDRANVSVHFHFILSQTDNVSLPYINRCVKQYLGHQAIVHTYDTYSQYLTVLYGCDMMLSPFPVGNYHEFFDMVSLGLVGIHKVGEDIHEQMDFVMLSNANLPVDKLVAQTADDYVQKAVWLAENHEERLTLREQAIQVQLQSLFSGQPEVFASALMNELVSLGMWQTTTSKKSPSKAPKAKATKANKESLDKQKATTTKITKSDTSSAKSKASRVKKAEGEVKPKVTRKSSKSKSVKQDG